MTTEEMRELDAWIGRNVFKKKVCMCHPDKWVRIGTDGDSDLYCNCCNSFLSDARLINYTTDPAAAMLVLEKCCQSVPLVIEVGVCHFGTQQQWFVGRPDDDSTKSVMADTLPLAICLFSKALFSN